MALHIKEWLEKQLVSGDALKKLRAERAKEFEFKKDVPECYVDEEMKKGWQVHKVLKKKRVVMRREKKQGAKFEDRVWRLFASMGFDFLNANYLCQLPIDKPYDETNLTAKKCHQVDILAIDEDCVFFVECKSAENEGKTKNFRRDIEILHANHKHYCRAIKEACPYLGDVKFKSIFITQRYNVSQLDIDLMANNHIHYLDESDLMYYEALASQLGSASKYQFCAHVIHDQEIKGMKNNVPAIKGNMGGHIYYSFSIEPEKLLKMSIVAHRRNGDVTDSSTYQRLIKKERLQSVRDFINSGNYFPNSIIINVINERASGREVPLVFHPTQEQVADTESCLGILELPKKYGCAFVIDGQHRLYGYSDSKYSRKNTIPVVLFENLSTEEQIKLFMDINQNQKSVPKELKNTLTCILDSDSKDPKKRQNAILLSIASELGTNPCSPLHNYVKLLEHKTTNTRQVTTTAIHTGLKDTDFFNKYTTQKKNSVVDYGLFAQENAGDTRRAVFDFLVACLQHIYRGCEEEWKLGNGSDENPGILTINPAITAIIKVISDIARTISKKQNLHPIRDKKDFNDSVFFYLDSFNRYINTIAKEDKQELRKHIGAGGPDYYAMTFRNAIYKERNDLDIDVNAMNRYLEDESRVHNAESTEIVRRLRQRVREFAIHVLKDKYPGDGWLIKGTPQRVYEKLNNALAQYKYKNVDCENIREEDMIDFDDALKIFKEAGADAVCRHISIPKYKYTKLKEALSFVLEIASMNLTKESVKVADFERLKSIEIELNKALNVQVVGGKLAQT